MPNPEAVQELPLAQRMMQMLTGKWIAQAISVAAALGIADSLAGGPETIEQLAAAGSVQADSLHRLLRALASVGIFAETEDGRFRLTPLAECLRSDAPDSIRNWARMLGLPLFWQSWGELLHSIKTGEGGLKKAFGVASPFTYLAQHPEDAKVFDGAMTDMSRNHGPSIARAYNFGKFRKIVDVGGGHGALLISILRQYAGPCGVVFDLPHVIQGAQAAIAAAGLSDRCETTAGDLFESVTPGADAYLMRSIIHGFNKERALVVLQNIRRSIRPEGRLLLVDFVIPLGNEPSLGKLVDLQMLIMSESGRERTLAEFKDLLGDGGFRLGAIYPTASPQSIIEGIPA